MQKILSQLFLLCLLVGTQVIVMIFGWGLQPKSWWWIIGVGVFVNTVWRALADKLEKDDKPAAPKEKVWRRGE